MSFVSLFTRVKDYTIDENGYFCLVGQDGNIFWRGRGDYLAQWKLLKNGQEVKIYLKQFRDDNG